MQERLSPSELQQADRVTNVHLDFGRRPATAPVARIHLLGRMRASSVRHADLLPRGRKARAILGWLCLEGGAPVPRATLAAVLWDRVPDFQARASFRQAFRELSVAFGPLADDLLRADRDTVRLDTSMCWIDAVALLSEEEGADDARVRLAELCKGELLEGLTNVSVAFDQWLLHRRTAFAENLRKLLEGKLSQTRQSEREEIARRLIEFDPTHEGASRILMRALADRKERIQALIEYKRLQASLRQTLDAEPSAETRALAEAIRMVTDGAALEVLPVESTLQKDAHKLDSMPKRSHRRVGVLPFRPIPTAVDDNLAISIAQEVAAALARFRFFDIVAPTGLMRGPVPTFLNDVELRRKDLDYVIDGTVARVRDIYQISVRLLDLKTDATPVWSEKFDLPVDRWDLLDEKVTRVIAAQIDPVIIYIEGPKKLHVDDDALGCLMRALPLLHTMERPKYEEAGDLLRRARKLEPENAVVLSWLAYWHVYYVGQNWSKDGAEQSRAALTDAKQAIDLDPTNAEALAIYAHLLAFVEKKVDEARTHMDRALVLNPSTPFVWAYSALNYCYRGDPDKALEHLDRCRKLTATLPFFTLYENPFVIAYLMKKDYEKAAAIGRRVVEGTPYYVNGYKPFIAALGHLRRRKEARRYVDRLLELEPDFTVKLFGQRYAARPADLEHYMEGLRRAGVPEG